MVKQKETSRKNSLNQGKVKIKHENECVFCWPSTCWACGPSLRVVCFASKKSVENLIFFSAYILCVYHAALVHTALVSVCSYVNSSWWYRGPHFRGVLHLHQPLHSLCHLYYRVHWAPRRGTESRHTIEDRVLEGLSLHIVWLWVSVFVPTCSSRKLLWWCLGKTLTYEYRRMSLTAFSIYFLMLNK